MEPPNHPDPLVEDADLYDCTAWQPPTGEVVRLFLNDGEAAIGWWDGYRWWSRSLPVDPDYWKPLELHP
jgi:hypothetical protein